jgi:hypothetical protein
MVTVRPLRRPSVVDDLGRHQRGLRQSLMSTFGPRSDLGSLMTSGGIKLG